jgi:hypothetical protein
LDFIENTWEKYRSEVTVDSMDLDIQKVLTQTILYNILRRRILIDKIKQAVNL